MKLTILSGKRQGESFTLTMAGSAESDVLPFVLEDEAIEFELSVPSDYQCLTLNLYDNEIPYTQLYESELSKRYVWSPGYSYNRRDSLFRNYFGLAELQVVFEDARGERQIYDFQPIEVLASKLSAERVEQMFDYLSELPDVCLFSVFHATRKSSSFEEGDNRPEFLQDRLEKITSYLEQLIPVICRSPITKLIPEQRVKAYTGLEEVDDNTIAWLSDNLSVLEPTDNTEKALLKHDDTFYRANVLQVPVLNENSDLYENRVIHGFVEVLLSDAHLLYDNLLSYHIDDSVHNNYQPSKYRSFFHTMSRFSKRLLGPRQRKCYELIERLSRIKYHLNKKLPVKVTVRHRPHVTPKVRVNRSYLEVFRQIIIWHENGKPDWAAFNNLFGIRSIPTLFEYFCFCRTAEHLNVVFDSEYVRGEGGAFKTHFTDFFGAEVKLLQEPDYWSYGHINSEEDKFVNSEGWTHYPNESKESERLRKRGTRGINSRRAPDIVIQVIKPNGDESLIVMDAKYTSPYKAFSAYLPELTMKYVHGIHRKYSSDCVVDSLTIIHPDDNPSLRRYHTADYSFDGKTPVLPALQSIGLIPGSKIVDNYDYLLKGLLSLHGVSLSRMSVHDGLEHSSLNYSKVVSATE